MSLIISAELEAIKQCINVFIINRFYELYTDNFDLRIKTLYVFKTYYGYKNFFI